MVKLDKIYTKGGDKGKTSLGNGKRVSKDSPRVDALGTIDEANAILGIIVNKISTPFKTNIKTIQNDLFDLGADMCVPEDKNTKYQPIRITQHQIDRLEKEIERINKTLNKLNSFILPGGSYSSSHLHVARTIVRKAERKIVKLSKKENINPLIIIYINRLSDLLFVIARAENKEKKVKDILWVPGKSYKT